MNSRFSMDTEALDGLRGVVSVHIVLFHALLYSKLQWHIIGSAHMPLFFILSGFVLALGDGAKVRQAAFPSFPPFVVHVLRAPCSVRLGVGVDDLTRVAR